MSKRTTGSSNIALRRRNAKAEGGEDYLTKRQELVSIAASLFKEQGYEQTTLADIAQRAKLDRATVYYYVGSKQELFRTSIEGSLDDNLREAETLYADGSLKPREKLERFLVALMQSYDRNYPQMFVYIQEQMHQVSTDPSKWAREIQRKTHRLETIVTTLIERGIERKELRGDLDPKLVMRGLFGMLNWTSRWYRPGGGESPAEVAATYASLFFDGMSK